MTAELSTSGDDFSVNGGKITDVADGVDPTDAANVSQIGAFSGDAGDIPFTPAGTIAATDVQAAIEEVAAEAGGGSTPTGTGFRHVAAGVEDAAAKLVEIADVNANLKPSGSAASTDESLRRLGTGSTHAAAGDDARFPTTGQKNALAGTSGTPGTGNEYVTDDDPRMTAGADLATHLADTVDAHDGSAISFSPVGTIAATDVQAAIAEVASEAVAGSGMSATLFDAKGDLLTATAADTPSILTVGANDTLLVADSGQAKGVKWATLPGGAQIPLSIIDAKGDLIVGTAADTAARLAVGADGTIPMADSGETTGVKWSPFTPRRAGGSSTSNTPGTSIADVNVTAGNKLVAWTVHAGQASAANTQITVTVTFADATTMALASVAASATVIIGNWGELLRIVSGVMNSSSAAGANKDVTRIQVTTLGTGTGARWAAISALEVWIP